SNSSFYQREGEGERERDIEREYINKKNICEVPSKKRNFTEEAKEVFRYWQQVFNHPQAKLTKDRQRKIEARLKEGYTVEQCKKAINGCRASPYHMGDNERGKVYDSISLIFRNADKMEDFWKYLEQKGKSQPSKTPVPAYYRRIDDE
ncbi:MAG: hypothetical protein J7K87_02575, partial [Candidatus Aenigmarchaeota archaeon]|nr:hypothetical protein [Candidatus Aenigmarchaeota archaeon]